ncbi:MAG: DUF3558 domain-containing protein [Pseudonocardia sp.]
MTVNHRWVVNHRWAAAVSAGLVAFALAGCGTDASPAGASPAAASPAAAAPPEVNGPLPARPVELPLDGLEPCGLLTSPQLASLGIPDQGARAPNSDLLGSASCLWAGSLQPPHGSPQVTAVTKQGVDYFRTPSDQVVDIAGMPALQATSEDLDPAVHCLVLVDVAAGQTLWVQYSPEGPTSNGSTHEIACDHARDAARAMVATLREQLHR